MIRKIAKKFFFLFFIHFCLIYALINYMLNKKGRSYNYTFYFIFFLFGVVVCSFSSIYIRTSIIS